MFEFMKPKPNRSVESKLFTVPKVWTEWVAETGLGKDDESEILEPTDKVSDEYVTKKARNQKLKHLTGLSKLEVLALLDGKMIGMLRNDGSTTFMVMNKEV